MKIKNNSIIVRKCTKEVFNTLMDNGFTWLDKTNKVLTVPFHVFKEQDLKEELKDLTFYGVALENEKRSIMTNLLTINKSFTCAKDFSGKEITFSPCAFMKEVEELCTNTNNLNSFDLFLESILDFSKNPSIGETIKDVDIIVKKISTSYKKLYKDEREYNFIKHSIIPRIIEEIIMPLKKLYNNVDLAFWYHTIPEN